MLTAIILCVLELFRLKVFYSLAVILVQLQLSLTFLETIMNLFLFLLYIY